MGKRLRVCVCVCLSADSEVTFEDGITHLRCVGGLLSSEALGEDTVQTERYKSTLEPKRLFRGISDLPQSTLFWDSYSLCFLVP